MNIHKHEIGTLTFEDDDEIIHTYRVSVAEYNLYEKEGLKWLTFYCRTDQKISPKDVPSTDPWMEIGMLPKNWSMGYESPGA
jgi:hypothetical protein